MLSGIVLDIRRRPLGVAYVKLVLAGEIRCTIHKSFYVLAWR